MKHLTLFAPSKVNLYLEVTGTTTNGYHTLNTVYQSLSLGDTIKLYLEKNSPLGINLQCSNPLVPTDSSNLAYKAAKYFFVATGFKGELYIDIHKTVPMEAGLGGGSSDGGAVLVGLNQLYDYPLKKAQLLDIGKSLGADVPFSIVGGTCLGTGIGDKLIPLPPIPNCYFVLAKPALGVSTPDAFKALDENPKTGVGNIMALLESIQNRNLTSLGQSLYNDFEQVILVEETKIIKEAMEKKGSIGAVLTGTGSTVVGLFETFKQAKICQSSLKELSIIDFSVVATPYPQGVHLIPDQS